MSEWDAWIGRRERRADRVDDGLARRWCATFDLPPPDAGALPQGIHFALCVPDAPTAVLGEDGHPRREGGDSFLPPIPLPRRMWAGSVINFHRPIAVDDPIERISRIVQIAEKPGSSGALVFIELEHHMVAGDVTAVSERQTLVYREAAAGDVPLSPPVTGTQRFDTKAWDAHRIVTPDERLLFRYSALTFNSHRIHYDLPYARDFERYRGLVVHGPLTASLLLQLAARQFGENRLASFTFRGLSPAVADEPLNLVMRGAGDCLEMAAFGDDGRQVTKAEAVLR